VTGPADDFANVDFSLSVAKAGQLRAAAKEGLIERHPAFSIIDFDALEKTVARLRDAFPAHFLHAFAIKANQYPAVLETLASLGLGGEAAAPGELELAVRAGFDATRMVLDSPVKTADEIARALRLGIVINIDNFQEFEQIRGRGDLRQTGARIGFRINPQVGAGTVGLSSTATLTSKFGVGLRDPGNRARLVDTYLEHEWLNALHVHVGSVGCPLELMAQGVSAVVALATEINGRADCRKIRTIDIGGGLPVSFVSDADTPEFADYARLLEARVPELFTGEFDVITEFGRAIVAKSAFTVARVEYTKTMGGRHIALTHAGAHNMMRIVFQPAVWARRVTALNAKGEVKSGTPVEQDIAGPCCFAGDVIAHRRGLPLLERGDLVMVHDTGAYCFSNHFYYNALSPDPVYACRRSDAGDRYRFSRISAADFRT